MITIANPIYDSVFKFFMEDTEVAKRLISNIIGAEVTAITPKPQEITTRSQKYALALLRLDYTAVIKDQKGEESKVIIEMQKAEQWPDIQRFRRYLGENLNREEPDGAVLPIICIYFIGFSLLKRLHSYAVLKSDGQIIDVLTNTAIPEQEEIKKHDFVKLLTHTSYFIQIPFLPPDSQNVILKRLSVFSQYRVNPILKWQKQYENWEKIPDNDLKLFIHRLWLAVQDTEVQEQALAEVEIDSKFDNMERKIEIAEQKLEQTKQKLENTLQNLENIQQNLENTQQNLENAQQKLEKAILAMHHVGLDADSIAGALNLSANELSAILNKR